MPLYIIQKSVEGRVKSFTVSFSADQKDALLFMTSHNVPFSYTAADVEVVSCLSLSLWEASFILL